MGKQILTIILFSISSLTFACSCKWGGNFIKSSKDSEVIIKAKVVDVLWHFDSGKTFNNEESFGDYLIKTNEEHYKSTRVEVIELIKGKEERRIFEIYGSDGVDCRESIHLFEIDRIYIFGIYKSRKTEYSQPNEDENDYAIGGCSEKWLEFLPETNKVKGYIKGQKRKKKRKYDYEKLVKKIT
ncbi:hypothetical protein [Leeuwenhoekiella nanhaiensis]|uniref:Lipoprotein n=1 Tax=Leeuwenhoekiella nanhaiensis TaxID=1655491 RepID=A0A2G1VMP6_9FLAO|nr:hypothetical protein [Leeuwenhoekiella nanhaiensis]PHQ28047.1 hypothetical protein CJ305_16655 [Leeuwenhoekiella nanhaiensis]